MRKFRDLFEDLSDDERQRASWLQRKKLYKSLSGLGFEAPEREPASIQGTEWTQLHKIHPKPGGLSQSEASLKSSMKELGWKKSYRNTFGTRDLSDDVPDELRHFGYDERWKHPETGQKAKVYSTNERTIVNFSHQAPQKRTDAFRFTLHKGSSEDAEKLEKLKSDVKAENERIDGLPPHEALPRARRDVDGRPVFKKQVHLKSRLGKNNPAAEKYRGKSNFTIHPDDAERFDVYVYDRQ